MTDFVLSSALDGTRLALPSNPEKLSVGSTSTFTEIAIEDLGSVPVPIGRDATSYSWSGIFYGPARIDLPHVKQWRPPLDIIAQVDHWVDQQRLTKRTLLLEVTDSPVNKDVYIKSWQYDISGGFGDYSYQLELVEARIVALVVDGEAAGTTSGDIQSGGNTTPEGGEEAPTPASYTVQSGDSLWSISNQVYGDTGRWRDIYDANIDAIGNNPDVIQPGLVLNIPGGTTPDIEGTTDELDPLDAYVGLA